MKIESSTVVLESQHASVERHTVRESLRFWTGDTHPDFEGRGRALGNPAFLVSISDAAKSAQAKETEAITDSAEDAENDPKVQLILRMLEAMTGRKIKLVKAEDLQPDEKTQKHLDKAKEAGEAAQQQRAGWGLEYDYHESHYEAEITTFSAAVFADLRVWRKDAGGNDSLSTLAQSGVGALYLGNVTTPFSVNTASNTNLGQVRSSGGGRYAAAASIFTKMAA